SYLISRIANGYRYFSPLLAARPARMQRIRLANQTTGNKKMPITRNVRKKQATYAKNIVIWKLSDSFPWSSTNFDVSFFMSQTMSGQRKPSTMAPRWPIMAIVRSSDVGAPSAATSAAGIGSGTSLAMGTSPEKRRVGRDSSPKRHEIDRKVQG